MLLEEAHVLLVEAAVRGEVAERRRRQPERARDRMRGARGERAARAFEHVHHAKEAGGIHPRDIVIDVGHHQLGGRRRRRAPRSLRVVAAGAQVVEDPFLVAVLLGDVLRHRAAQRGALFAEPAAAGHQQRHRVLHVVVGLAQEGDIARARDAAGEAVDDRRHRKQRGAIGRGAGLQLVKERHRGARRRPARVRRGARGRWRSRSRSAA